MLNQPYAEGEMIEEIIDSRLDQLVTGLHRLGYKQVEKSDIEYQLFDRVEHLYIPSEVLYPNSELEIRVGCGRGYHGGGMHSGLGRTMVSAFPKKSQAKVEKAVQLFVDTFWAILDDVDKASADACGVDNLEEWDTTTI